MEKLPLSLVVITFNEESNIERCLQSVPFADDIVVVDSHSTDQTRAIAERCGARVVTEAWRGYGAQKALATSLAKNDWVLNLDADEALSPELATEILAHFSKLDPATGYLMPRKSFHLGRWILHGGWYPDYQLRLFHRQQSQWSLAEVHEKVNAKLEVRLQQPLLHWVFEDLSDQVKTNDKYSSLGAQQLERRGQKFSLFKLLVKPVSKFLECYLWKRGFMDGLPGFIIAVGAAYSVFLKFAKLWEMQNKRKGL